MKGKSKSPALSLPVKSGPFEVGGQTLQLSNLDKVLYPAAGFTKGQVIDYYARIAPVLVPYLTDRPLTLKRYPNGVDAPFFYEKRCPPYRPPWMKTAKIKSESKESGFLEYCTVNDAAALLWVVNLASLELHTLLSRGTQPVPTMMVFDLDPGAPATLLDCIDIAIALRDVLKKLGMECFAKTSGSKGLHLSVPLNQPRIDFEQTKQFSHALALMLEKQFPDRVTSVMKRDIRGGKVFVDWSQNDDHKTTACVYSLRARQEPTVSTPVAWKELETAKKRGDISKLSFRTDDVLKRVEKFGDLFEPVLKLKQKLPKALG